MRQLCVCVLVGAGLVAAESPTIAIKIDQAGYPAGAPKLAFVAGKDAAVSFQVKDARSGKAVLSGRLSAPAQDADSGDAVQAADFSSVKEPGTYYIDVAGVGRSWDFAI